MIMVLEYFINILLTYLLTYIWHKRWISKQLTHLLLMVILSLLNSFKLLSVCGFCVYEISMLGRLHCAPLRFYTCLFWICCCKVTDTYHCELKGTSHCHCQRFFAVSFSKLMCLKDSVVWWCFFILSSFSSCLDLLAIFGTRVLFLKECYCLITSYCTSVDFS